MGDPGRDGPGATTDPDTASSDLRIEVDWRNLELATPAADGYAPCARPIEETVTEQAKKLGGGRRPSLVYLFDGRKQEANLYVEEIFRDEKICIALQHFLCLRADLKSIPDRRRREELRARAPILMFLDPGGRPLHSVTGRRVASRPGLARMVAQVWQRSFTIPLRTYVQRKDDILDRRESLERKRDSLLLRADRFRDKPARLIPLRRDIEAVEKELREVLADDRKLRETVVLRHPPDEPGGQD